MVMWAISLSPFERKHAMSIESLCTGCGICQEKCPKKVIDDVYEAGLGYRKAVYTPFPRQCPNIRSSTKKTVSISQKEPVKPVKNSAQPAQLISTRKMRSSLCKWVISSWQPATICSIRGRVTQYGYGRLANVFTSLEFERLTNAAGPTNGNIVLRDGVTRFPKPWAIIHCVGSRDRNFNNYCSVICCMQSLKFAHLVHERTGATVYNFYIDMRTAYKEYDEFYQRVLEEGTLFVRGKVAEVTDAARLPGEEGKLIVQVEDTLVGKQRRIPVDMVVLSAAMEPRQDAKEVAHLFGISCSANGWFIEKHPKLDPVATMTEGIFIAGCVQGPKDIPSSVAQGAAASARVIGRIQQGQIALEPVRATVIEEKCSGCRICNNLCPFNAILFHEDRMVTEINPASLPGLRHLRGSLPGWRHHRHWF